MADEYAFFVGTWGLGELVLGFDVRQPHRPTSESEGERRRKKGRGREGGKGGERERERGRETASQLSKPRQIYRQKLPLIQRSKLKGTVLYSPCRVRRPVENTCTKTKRAAGQPADNPPSPHPSRSALACSQGPDPLLSCPAYGSIPQGMAVHRAGLDWPSLICCDVVSVALSLHLPPTAISPPFDHIQGRLIMALVPPWLCLSTGRSFRRTSSQKLRLEAVHALWAKGEPEGKLQAGLKM